MAIYILTVLGIKTIIVYSYQNRLSLVMSKLIWVAVYNDCLRIRTAGIYIVKRIVYINNIFIIDLNKAKI